MSSRRQILEAAAREAARQREALRTGDRDAVARCYDSLAQLLALLAETASGPVTGEERAMAETLRDALLLNQALCRNGILVADHFAGCLADAAPAARGVILSGVA